MNNEWHSDDLQFTLWVKARWSWELVITGETVAAMAGSLCCRGLCRETLISAAFIPPIYTPTSPYECVGLGLTGVSHSFDQSESCPLEKRNLARHMLSGHISRGQLIHPRGTDGALLGGRVCQRKRLRKLCVNLRKWWPCRGYICCLMLRSVTLTRHTLFKSNCFSD